MSFIYIFLFLYGVWAVEGTAHGDCGREDCGLNRCECKDGCYGEDCRHSCSTRCGDNKCDATTGNCYYCSSGYYGDKCDRECPSGCNGKTCDSNTGSCNEYCTAGFFGRMCSKKCPEHCHTGMCNKQTGECHKGCITPYEGDFCNETKIVAPSARDSATSKHTGSTASQSSKPSFIVMLTTLHKLWSVFLS